jgi:Tfp pilus assembly protein PilX
MMIRTSIHRHDRRGTVAIVLVVALVMLQLVVVGVVLSGARDSDLTARRVETMRAFYACEAGMNMAIREVYQGVDEDGDGSIGTLSGDEDDSNDPTVGSASFHVTRMVSGSDTTLTSAGRSGLARRSAEAVIR